MSFVRHVEPADKPCANLILMFQYIWFVIMITWFKLQTLIIFCPSVSPQNEDKWNFQTDLSRDNVKIMIQMLFAHLLEEEKICGLIKPA